MTRKLFSELGLSPELLKAIDKLGFEQAAPIQSEAIPILLQGRDVVGQSQTGSGKTAAFAIPAIEKTDTRQRAVQVLVLCPTRELAIQVAEEVHKLSLFKRGLHALPIYGGQSYERQFYGLKQGAQIVIGTPGRVMDHIRRGTLQLGAVRMVILDEADVMLDMGFREDIEFILQQMSDQRQTVFFSATMPRPIQDLIQRFAKDPANIRIEQQSVTVPTVEQIYYEVDRRFKMELLTRLIDLHDYKLGIIFCNTKRMVDDLVDHLEVQGYSADRLHGDMSQGMRDRVMNKFRKSGLDFLVATDVAARGIDVDDVQVVFNYDLPYDVQDYVHRIGRTGRAGRSGRAISFVAGRELFQVQQIERFTRTRIHRARIPSPSEVEEARADIFLERLRTTLRSGEFPKQENLLERLLEEGFSFIDIASVLIYHLQSGEGNAESRSRAMDTRDTIEREPSRHREPQRRLGDRTSEHAPRQVGAPTAKKPIPLPSPEVLPPPRNRNRNPVPAPAPAPTPPVPTPVPLPPPEVPIKQAPPLRPEPPRPVKPPTPPRPPMAKHVPRPKEGQVRLHISIGSEMGATRNSITEAIAGQTGLPSSVVSAVDVRERYTFVDVAAEHANAIIAKLNRSKLGYRRLKVKAA